MLDGWRYNTDPDHSECICQCQCHHYPPTCPPQTAFILHRLAIDQDVACVVDLTSDPVLQSLCPASWPFCCVNAALLSSCTTVSCLKIVPEEKQLILAEGSSLSLTCAGSSETTWDFKSDDVPFFQMKAESSGLNYKIVQSNSTTSVLTLWHVDWKYTGLYQCREQLTGEIKEVTVFVPGKALFELLNPQITFYDLLHGAPFRSIIYNNEAWWDLICETRVAAVADGSYHSDYIHILRVFCKTSFTVKPNPNWSYRRAHFCSLGNGVRT